MKVISISRNRYKELKELILPREILNTEAKILDFKYKNQEKVLKALYYLEGRIFANKLYTIEMLDNYKEYLPTSFLIPDSLCAVNNEIIGFTIPKFNGINLSSVLIDNKIDKKEQIYYLKKIGEILDQLKNIRTYTKLKEIYINDLHDSNFLVDLNKRELKVIDLDSCKIKGNDVSVSKYLNEFSILNNSNKYKINKGTGLGYIVPDENSDLFCYNTVILNYLYKDKISQYGISEFYEYLNYLSNIGVHKDLIDIFSKIVNNCDNENPSYYLDSLTDEQIYRASRKIFTKVKNRV